MSKKTNRQNRILNQLEVNPRIRVNEMAEDLGVSTETVRRDLAELDDAGRIQRTYGGAVSIKTFEPALAERSTLHVGPENELRKWRLNTQDLPIAFYRWRCNYSTLCTSIKTN